MTHDSYHSEFYDTNEDSYESNVDSYKSNEDPYDLNNFNDNTENPYYCNEESFRMFYKYCKR